MQHICLFVDSNIAYMEHHTNPNLSLFIPRSGLAADASRRPGVTYADDAISCAEKAMGSCGIKLASERILVQEHIAVAAMEEAQEIILRSDGRAIRILAT